MMMPVNVCMHACGFVCMWVYLGACGHAHELDGARAQVCHPVDGALAPWRGVRAALYDLRQSQATAGVCTSLALALSLSLLFPLAPTVILHT